jgi:hypothetical protein
MMVRDPHRSNTMTMNQLNPALQLTTNFPKIQFNITFQFISWVFKELTKCYAPKYFIYLKYLILKKYTMTG